MSIDIFAEWLKRQGHQVFQTASSYWFDQGPRVFQAFPYHWLIEPEEAELHDFLRQHKAIGLRYSTPLSAPSGKLSYHALYEKPTYGFEDLGKWARKNVRNGLKNCSIEPIKFEQLARDGFALQRDTLNRQGRKLDLKFEKWYKLCMAANDLPGFEAWGALVNKNLAASLITFQMEDCCYMLYQQSHRDYLNDHVNNALSFVVTKTIIERPEIHRILYGLNSLDAPPSVDEFKFRMGYTAKSVRQRVVFDARFQPIVGSASHVLLRGLIKLFPGNPTLAKAEGLFRFYLHGKLPFSMQTPPGPLQKAALLPGRKTDEP